MKSGLLNYVKGRFGEECNSGLIKNYVNMDLDVHNKLGEYEI